MKLQKFNNFSDLKDFLTENGYYEVFYDIEFLLKDEARNSTTNYKKLLLEWWNEKMTKKHPMLKVYRRSYFLLWHLKKELKKK